MKKSKEINRKKFNRWFWGLFFTPIILLALLFTLIGCGVFGNLPTFEELEFFNNKARQFNQDPFQDLNY